MVGDVQGHNSVDRHLAPLQCACRAWRAALAARPIQQRSLCLGAKHCWQGGADDPSRRKALACARWAAARKPVALGVELMIPYLPDEELAAAVSGALHALYSREVRVAGAGREGRGGAAGLGWPRGRAGRCAACLA